MLKCITSIRISHRLLLAFLFAAVIPGIVISTLYTTFAKQQAEHGRTIQANIYALKFTTTTGGELARTRLLLDSAYLKRYGPITNKHTSPQQIDIQSDIDQLQTLTAHIDRAFQQYSEGYAVATAPQMEQTRIRLQQNDQHAQLLEKQQAAFDQVSTNLWPTYKSLQGQLTRSIERKAPARQTIKLRTTIDGVYTSLIQQWNTLSDVTATISYTTTGIVSTETNPMLFLTWLALLGTVVVISIIGYVLYRSITEPLHQLKNLTERVTRGNHNARVAITGHDEIFQAATSINSMLDYLVYLIQTAETRYTILQDQVEKLVNEVHSVNEGDLRIQVGTIPDAPGLLADSFNYMIEALGSLIVRVKTVSNEVDAINTNVRERATRLIEADNQQIANIEEATTKLEHISNTNRRITERIHNVSNATRMTRSDAQGIRESLEQVVRGMGRINEQVQLTKEKVTILDEQSQKINEIVEIIATIAYQTNRLALDAAIQAALSGENGKGFGAVASDIRRLAERIKDYTCLITRIIRSLRNEIGTVATSMQDTERETGRGTQATEEAEIAMESILTSVEQHTHEVEQINQIAMRQLQTSKAVVRIMQAVTEANQQSIYSTQEVSRHTVNLKRLLEQLRSSVEIFKLRANQRYQIPNTQIMLDLNHTSSNSLSGHSPLRTVTNSLPPTSRLITRRLSSGTYAPPVPPPPSTEHEYLSPASLSRKTIRLDQEPEKEIPKTSVPPEKPTSEPISAQKIKR